MRSQRMTGVEWSLALAVLAWLALAVWSPATPQRGHDFADQRTLWQVPFAMDVLSNLAVAVAGALGLRAMRRLPPRRVTNMQRAMGMLFFGGLVLTAAGSAWYHAQPGDATLSVDRSGMAVAFAGLLGFAVASHASERAAAVAGPALLLFGAWAANVSSDTGNLTPWITLQGGGMVLLVWLALLRRRRGAPDVRWSVVIVASVAAKLLELQDYPIYELTGGAVSGHALAHVAAALAAAPVVAALRALPRQRRERRRPAGRPVASGPLGDA